MLKEALVTELHQAAAEYLKAPVIAPIDYASYQTYLTTGERRPFSDQYFTRRRQLAVMGLSQTLAPTPEKKAFLEEVLWAVCQEYTWGLPAHMPLTGETYGEDAATWIDLFAAETGSALAELLDRIGDTLSPEIQQRVANEIERRIFRPFEAHDWAWEYKTNNWSAVIGGCIGMTALYLLPKGSHRQMTMLHRLDTAFDTYLGSFGADGASEEGVSYWSYGFGYYIYYADLYRSVFGDDRYLKAKKVQAIAGFPNQTQLGPNEFVPFSDYDPLPLPSGLVGYCRDTFGVTTPPITRVSPLNFDHCYRYVQLDRNLNWTPKEADAVAPLPKMTAYMPDVQWLVMRDSDNQVAFAAKGGRNDESHNHLDLGHFVFGTPDALFLDDLGAGEYTRDYFDDTLRYDYFIPSTAAHSVPLIDGIGQGFGAYQAQATRTEEGLHLDLTAAYPGVRGAKLTRDFAVSLSKRRVVVTDTLTLAGAHTLTEQFVTRVAPQIDGQTATIETAAGQCVLTSPTGALTVAATDYLDHDGKNARAYVLTVTIAMQDTVTAATTIELQAPRA